MTPQSELTVRRPVVVVVDDDIAVCNSLKFSLQLEGFVVRAYRSSAELLDADDLDACDCFVIDQKMPDLTGMQLIEQLRRRQISAPAILIVGRPTVTLAAQAAKNGIPLVEKPLLGNMLLTKIREACEITRR
ncbi:MAG TPA: response regulator [Xanthobacteraceae bacterium]|jgi:FixJ family two-component response regulator|nr:response regulator [Xanthobacteraceae bacterium]